MSQNSKYNDIFSLEYGENTNNPKNEEFSKVNSLNDIFSLEYGETEKKVGSPLNKNNIIQTDLSNIDTSNISINTFEQTGDDLLNLELNQKGSSESALKNLNDLNYEANQKIHSTDYGLFQINDSYHDQTSQEMFGKGVADLSPLENIELASVIAKNNYGPSNWVAYKEGNHKQFEGITDEDMVTDYGISPEIIDSINEEGKFSDPQLYKQILLAESAGKLDAVKINYTPQEDGKEVVPPEMLRDTQSVLQNLAQPEPMEASSTDVTSLMEQFEYPTFGLTGTQLAPKIQELSEKGLKFLTQLDSPMWDTRELKELKPVVQLGVNALSRVAEVPGMLIDIPTSLIATPEEAVIGLLKFVPEQFNELMIATNVLDVVNPFLKNYTRDKSNKLVSIDGSGYTLKELNEMRNKAQKHIFDTGGIYTYFAAHGLSRAGKKNSKIVEKNKEFRDVVELANERPPKGVATKEMVRSAKALIKDKELKKKAEQIQADALTTDFIENYKVKKSLEKAEKASIEQLELQFKEQKPKKKSVKQKESSVSTELDLGRDVPSIVEVVKKEKEVSKKIKKVEEKVQKTKEKIETEQAKQKTQSTEVNLERDVPSSTEIVQEIKIKKSSDLGKAKNLEPIKGEPAKRYNSKEKVNAYIEQKLGEYVGQNVVANYGKLKDGKYIVKVFKKTKEQPLPTTATKPKPRDIKPDTTPEIQPKMRDPRVSKRRIQNKEILAEKYKLEIAELNRSVAESLKELDRLKEQTLKTGIKSPRIELVKNSINKANSVMVEAQKNLRDVMTPKQLIKRVVKNISKRTAKGSVGRNIKKTQKERIKEQLQNQELVNDIKKLWELGETNIKMTKINLLKYLKDINAPIQLRNHVKANFKEFYDTATAQNAKDLALEIDAKLPQSQGAIEPTRTATRTKDEYFNNLRVDIMAGENPNPQRLATIDLLESMVENIGGEKATKAKGTRSIETIKRGSQEQNVASQVIYEALNNKLSVENLPEKLNSILSLTGDAVQNAARTKNPTDVALAQELLKASFSYISEPARAVRSMRDATFEPIREWKNYANQFGDFPEIQDLLLNISNRKEIKRSSLFKLAEWGRNMKLATGSSLIRSLAGNSMSTLDAYGRLPFEFGFDYLISSTSKGLYKLSNGHFGNLSKNQMSRLEIGAQFNGHFRGFREAGNLMFDMLMENDVALRNSTFFKREGFTHKDIKGKKGVIIRTPQRLQGMIDIMFRVPITNGYMNRFAIRQAIKEGYKTEGNILQRASEIMKDKALDSKLLKEAVQSGEYVTFQKELGQIGQYVNKLRTGNTAMSAGAQMLVPFFNTASNLFKYTLEHTPLNVFSKNFRQGAKEAFTREGAGSRALATEMGKMTTGLGTMYLINEFLLNNSAGNITGDWSNISAEERNMRTVDGQQEHSFKTADGNWVSYRGFEPVASYMTLIDALQRTEKDAYASDESLLYYGDLVRESTKELANSFLENPFLAGTGDLFKVMNSRKDATNFFFNFMAGMTVPGTVRQLESINYPFRTQKLKASDIDENVNWKDVIKSQAKGVFPWLIPGYENLDALDPFGNPIPKPDPEGGTLAIRRTTPKNDPVYAEIQTTFFDRDEQFKYASPFYTNTELAKINLTPKEHFDLIKISGNALYDVVEKLLATDEYNKLNNYARYKIIKELKNKLIETYRTQLHSEKYAPIKAKMMEAEITGQVNTDKEREQLLRQFIQ